jgi:hypothetical protein
MKPLADSDFTEKFGHFQRVGVPESLGVAALEQQRLDLMSGSGLTVVASMLEERFGGRRGTMSTAFVALAVINSGVVVIAIAGAVVLVVLLVTVSMRGRQKRGAKERGEARRADEGRQKRGAKERGEARRADEGRQKRGAKERGEARRADEAREAGREHDRDTVREGGEDLGPDR